MSRRPVTVAVIGTGTIDNALACDLLNDQFAFGPCDEDGYFEPSELYNVHVLLPGGEGTGDGVAAVWQWALRCELEFALLHDGTDNKAIGAIRDSLDDEAHDRHLVTSVASGIIGHLQEGENPMLLVLSGEAGALDEEAEWTAAQALREGIPVYDLSRAFRQIEWDDLEGHEEPPQVEEEPGGQLALVVSKGPDVTLSAADIEIIDATLNLADKSLAHFNAVLADKLPQVVEALTLARSILAPKPEAPATPASKTYMEVFNPDSGRWERAGRGRPRKGAQTRLVPRGPAA